MNWDDFSLIDLEQQVPPRTLERGIDYFVSGHLREACKSGNVLGAILTGTGGDYRTRLWIEDDNLRGECSCPVQGFCKHLVALGYGWLQQKEAFLDLTLEMERLQQDPGALPQMFTALIRQDPVNFRRILSPAVTGATFLENRTLLNLIRNLFSGPSLKLDQATEFAAKIDRVTTLLRERLEAGDAEAIKPFLDFLNGLLELYQNTHQPGLEGYLRDLTPALWKLSAKLSPESLHPLGEHFLTCYFTPDLWEWHSLVREILIPLFRGDLSFYREIITGKLTATSTLLELVALYELLLAVSLPETTEILVTITEKLKSDSSGRLWLIDRRLDIDPDEAVKLAKTGMRTWPELKPSFRDRLITIHHRRGELRQAASLSFIQFSEAPNFEEYLRLKNILASHPDDLRDYLHRIRALLNTGDRLLLLRILIAEKDYPAVAVLISEIEVDAALLSELSRFFNHETPPELLGVLPVLIKTALIDGMPQDWEPLLSLLTAYKKICLRDRQEEEWYVLREELLLEHGENPFFMRKCGALLRKTG